MLYLYIISLVIILLVFFKIIFKDNYKSKIKIIFYLHNNELNVKNGGNIVVLKTVELFNQNNIDCYLYSKDTNKLVNDRYDLPLTNIVDINSIVIYKDGTYGNPLGATNVCRWMLYYPAKRGGKELTDTWSKNDVLISYGNFTGNMKCVLDIDTVDFYEDIFKFSNKTNKRKKKFYIIHKALLQEWNNNDLNKEIEVLKSQGFEEVDNTESNKNLNDLLNEACILVSFDINTYISNIAVLCGCLSLVKKSKNNKSTYEQLFNTRGPYGTSGIKIFDESFLNQLYDLTEREKDSNDYRQYILNKQKSKVKINKFKKYFNL